jgi:hypothetical protein
MKIKGFITGALAVVTLALGVPMAQAAVPVCNTPTVSGSARPGNTITVAVSCTNSPTTYEYQWRKGGVAISGATSASYRVPLSDLGSNLSVAVFATNSSGRSASASISGSTQVFAKVELWAGSKTEGTSNGTGRQSATLTNPGDMAIDNDNNVYVCESNFRIRKFASDGAVSYFVGTGSTGSTDGMGISASFAGCNDLAFGKDGYLYLLTADSKIKRISLSGNLVTLATPSGVAIAAYSGSLVVDESGNIYLGREASGIDPGWLLRYKPTACNSGIIGPCYASYEKITYVAGAFNRIMGTRDGKIILKDSYSTYNFHTTDALNPAASSQTATVFAVSNANDPNASVIAIDENKSMYWSNSMVMYRLQASSFSTCPTTCTAVTPVTLVSASDINSLATNAATQIGADAEVDSKGYLYVSNKSIDSIFRIKVSEGWNPDPSNVQFTSLNLSGNSNTAVYRISKQIEAVLNVDSYATFIANGKRIPGCLNIRTNSANAVFSASCNWRPTTRGSVSITVRGRPVDEGMTEGYSRVLNVLVSNRGTTR